MNRVQVEYPKKIPAITWDTLKTYYPVRKYPNTDVSRETIARPWRGQPEVLKNKKPPVEEIKDYLFNYQTTKELMRSQSTLNLGIKTANARRLNKHTSCMENQYIYAPSRRLTDQPPQCNVFGTTEMSSSYTTPTIPARLVTDKNQFNHPINQPLDAPPVEWSNQKIEPLDTTHDGFEKYLDPYLTTNKLHYRPFTADQLKRPTVCKDVVTYYTFANIPWTRTPKPSEGEWKLPIQRPKSMYDRVKYKQDFREIRTHNKLRWVPGSFRTETRDKYIDPSPGYQSHNHQFENEASTYYKRCAANLSGNEQEEHSALKHLFTTEYAHIAKGKAVCSVVNQHIEKNKRLNK